MFLSSFYFVINCVSVFNYGMNLFEFIEVNLCLFLPLSISFKCHAWSFA